jgi:hypothetical protein
MAGRSKRDLPTWATSPRHRQQGGAPVPSRGLGWTARLGIVGSLVAGLTGAMALIPETADGQSLPQGLVEVFQRRDLHLMEEGLILPRRGDTALLMEYEQGLEIAWRVKLTRDEELIDGIMNLLDPTHLDAGTRFRIFEATIWGPDRWYRVEVLDGPHEGLRGWVRGYDTIGVSRHKR